MFSRTTAAILTAAAAIAVGGGINVPTASAADSTVSLVIDCAAGTGGVVEYTVEPAGTTAYLVIGDSTAPDGYAIWEGTITGVGVVDPYADMAGYVTAVAYDDANNVIGQAAVDCSVVTPPVVDPIPTPKTPVDLCQVDPAAKGPDVRTVRSEKALLKWTEGGDYAPC